MSDTLDIAAAWALLAVIFLVGYGVCYLVAGRDKWAALALFLTVAAMKAGVILLR